MMQRQERILGTMLWSCSVILRSLVVLLQFWLPSLRPRKLAQLYQQHGFQQHDIYLRGVFGVLLSEVIK
jgi:hypothetical protein